MLTTITIMRIAFIMLLCYFMIIIITLLLVLVFIDHSNNSMNYSIGSSE
jgi:hypothetical protein